MMNIGQKKMSQLEVIDLYTPYIVYQFDKTYVNRFEYKKDFVY